MNTTLLLEISQEPARPTLPNLKAYTRNIAMSNFKFNSDFYPFDVDRVIKKKLNGKANG